MKLSEVLKAFRLIKTGNHATHFQKYQPSYVTAMIPAGMGHHQSPYGHHLLLNPHYGHRGPIPGVASVTHIIRHGGSGTSANGAYGGQHGYHSNDYGGGHMGVSSGGHHVAPPSYDYHPPAGVHVPVADTTGPSVYSTGKSGKTGGSSTITALTLLSFLFFLNILQGCLKEHMDTMNPTVMVMTAGVARTRVSKLAEMNSREQQNTILSQVLPQPPLTLNRGEPYAADATTNVASQTPFNGGSTKIEYSNRPDPEPEYYPAYVNRTMTLADNNYQDRYHYPYRRYQRLPGPLSSLSPSSSSPSSFSSGSNSAGSNYYSETMDPYYTRIN